MDKKTATTPKSSSRNTRINNNRHPSKHELCLLELLKSGVSGIYKLSAIRAYGETSLPTTISELGLNRRLTTSRSFSRKES